MYTCTSTCGSFFFFYLRIDLLDFLNVEFCIYSPKIKWVNEGVVAMFLKSE